MTRAFSDDLRSRVLAASRDGMSARSAAARFGIGVQNSCNPNIMPCVPVRHGLAETPAS